MGRHLVTGQNGHAQGSSAGNFGQLVIPATQAGANGAVNAAFVGLGGLYQMTSQATAGAAGDMIAQSYQNPVATVNLTGRNLVVTSVYISTINLGAVVATTPTTLLWGLAVNGTAVTLATAETGSFVTATAHAPRRIPIGFQWIPVGGVIGQKYSDDLKLDLAEPLVIRPGEYLQTTVRFQIGTATASQTIAYTIAFNGYFE
jgi:hypothetical protein